MTDVRLGARMLAKSPVSSLLIVSLLAIGIGATTVMFSVFDAVLWRPLPVKRPEQLVRMVQRRPKLTYSSFPYAYYEALRQHSTTLANVFGETSGDVEDRVTMTAPGPAERVTVSGVTPEFFTGLGVNAVYGRILTARDFESNSDLPPAVLSYGFWQRRFHSDPQVVARGTIDLQRRRFAIAGVLPGGFSGWRADTTPDVRLPWRALASLENSPPESVYFDLAARLKPGFTRAQAEAECLSLWLSAMTAYYRDVDKVPPASAKEYLKQGIALDDLERGVSLLRSRYGQALNVMMGSIGLLLLIACANIGVLLLTRAAERQREIAVRLAIGATRARVLRQVLVENAILALAGAGGGILLALAGAPVLMRYVPPVRDLGGGLISISIHSTLDWRALTFAVLVSAATLLFFSAAPVLAVSRFSVDTVLRGVRASSSWRGRRVLIGAQIALCTFLLAVAILFVRTFEQLRDVNPGFDRDHIATFALDLQGSAISPEKEPVFRQRLMDAVTRIPGVASAAISKRGVMLGHGFVMSVAQTGQAVSRELNCSVNDVSPQYFETMGMRIVAGRGFTIHDTGPRKIAPTSLINVVVNHAFADKFFHNVDPVGKRFWNGYNSFEIIGVVTDAKYRSLREPIPPTFYTTPSVYGDFVLNVRVHRHPEQILQPVEKALLSVDSSLSFNEVHTLSQQAGESIAAERLEASLATLFGVFAALLVGVGTYGLLAQAVKDRNREIGIRMALGARPGHIRELIGRQIAILVLAGLVAGICGAVAASAWMRSLVYGISASDPASMMASASFVAIVAMLASIIPARRAIRIDPAESLRTDG